MKQCFSLFFLFLFFSYNSLLYALDIETIEFKNLDGQFLYLAREAATLCTRMEHTRNTIQQLLDNQNDSVNKIVYYQDVLEREKQQITYCIGDLESGNTIEAIGQRIKDIENCLAILRCRYNNYKDQSDKCLNWYANIVHQYGENPLYSFITSWIKRNGSDNWIRRPIGEGKVRLLNLMCLHKNYHCVQYLLSLDPTIINLPGDNNNLLPLDVAYLNGDENMVNFLSDYGAQLNPQFKKVKICIDFIQKLKPDKNKYEKIPFFCRIVIQFLPLSSLFHKIIFSKGFQNFADVLEKTLLENIEYEYCNYRRSQQ
jgi:hypothetical protein